MTMTHRLSGLILALCALSVHLCFGEDALVQGGDSPGGRYQVRIYNDSANVNDDGVNYHYAVIDSKSAKIIQRLSEGGGFAVYNGALEKSEVFWNSAGDCFALTDHGTRHSIEMYVYHVTPSNVSLLNTQDYGRNALGRVGATSGYATSVVKPLRWEKDDLICDYIFDARTERGRSPQYTVEFTLEIQRSSNMSGASLAFIKMGTPVGQGG